MTLTSTFSPTLVANGFRGWLGDQIEIYYDRRDYCMLVNDSAE